MKSETIRGIKVLDEWSHLKWLSNDLVVLIFFIIFSANMDKKSNLRMLCSRGNSFDHQQHEPRMKRALLFSHSVTRSCHERRHHSYLDNAERWCYFADSRLSFLTASYASLKVLQIAFSHRTLRPDCWFFWVFRHVLIKSD